MLLLNSECIQKSYFYGLKQICRHLQCFTDCVMSAESNKDNRCFSKTVRENQTSSDEGSRTGSDVRV